MLETAISSVQPRDYRAASRVISVLASVAAGVTVVFAAVQPGHGNFGAVALTMAVGVAVILAAWWMYRPHTIHPYYQLRQQAAVDPQTGLVTRRVLDQAAQSALSGAASRLGTALMLVDIDDFKLINDKYGHPAGDEVLVQLAALLIRGCRPNDIVSRLGGDELALLLLGCSQSAMVGRGEDLLNRIRAHPFRLNDEHTITITVSAGLAHAPTHATDLRELYSTADKALYRAKRAGRNRVGGPPAGPAESAGSGGNQHPPRATAPSTVIT